MEFLHGIYPATACALWSALYLYAALLWHRVPQFAHMQAPPPARWPRLSLIITACNEADTIGAALQTLCTQNYPHLEILVVNDRSTDATAAVIARFAAQDARIKLINIETLPQDWLGKVHALHSATQHATGEWLLFADADIHFHNNVLQRAVAWAEAEKLDHLALLPRTTTDSLLLKATMNAFGLLFLVSMRAQAVANPHSSAAIGVGAFNLVRRSVFDRTPGFTWLRMEVADDVGLAMLLKQHGAKTRFARADTALEVAWYPDLPAMARGLEKNIVGATTRYRTWRFVVNGILLILFAAAPIIALLQWHSIFAWFGIGVLISIALLTLRSVADSETSPLGWLLSPLGLLVIFFIYLRAGMLLSKRKGITWRGTHYSTEQLRRYQRVHI